MRKKYSFTLPKINKKSCYNHPIYGQGWGITFYLCIKLMVRPLLIFWLIAYCFYYRTRPWNFFQLNRTYFNTKKNIYSKLELDVCVPAKWRLEQCVDDGTTIPSFPVYVKPEWGQNSHGVCLVHDVSELAAARQRNKSRNVRFLLQKAACEQKEFDIFYIRSAGDFQNYSILSVTETLDLSGELFVISSINNPNTSFVDRTDELSCTDLLKIWDMVKTIGKFRIARLGVRADSLEKLIGGEFRVIETNIFLPMPLALLDKSKSWKNKSRFIRQSMECAARMCTTLKPEQKRHPIFFHKLLAHYKVKG